MPIAPKSSVGVADVPHRPRPKPAAMPITCKPVDVTATPHPVLQPRPRPKPIAVDVYVLLLLDTHQQTSYYLFILTPSVLQETAFCKRMHRFSLLPPLQNHSMSTLPRPILVFSLRALLQ